jgi:hypothetical protein
MRDLMAEMLRMNRHPVYAPIREALQAELTAAELTPPDEWITATATAKALWEMGRAAAFNIMGGIVHRGKRQVHRLAFEVEELQTSYFEWRAKIGLDKQQVETPITWSDAFKAAVLRDESDSADMAKRMAEGRRRMAPTECRRAVERENDARARLAEALRSAGLSPTAACEPISYEPTEDELQFCGQDAGAWDMVIRRKASAVSAVEPVALIAGPANPEPASPEPVPEPAPVEPDAGPVLELAPEPPGPEPEEVVEDLGNVPSTPTLETLRQRSDSQRSAVVLNDEPRFRPHVGRIAGTNLFCDESGYVMPNPFDYR